MSVERGIRNLSVVIPAMNEAQRLPSTLRAIDAWSRAHPGTIAELIVVDDGSTDSTAEVARSFPGTMVLSNGTNRGKGYSVRAGVRRSRGDFILLTDADLSTPIEEIERLASALNGADLAIGSRAVDERTVEVPQAWYRQRMGKIFNLVVRLLTGVPFRDTQCGFKLLRADAARRIFNEARVDRFAFDVEMLLLASRLELRVKEVPVRWINSPDSRVHIVRDSARMLLDAIAVWRRLGRWRASPE